ncbi:Putative LOC755078, partial [Caligus rogercresseyi]
NSCIMFHARGHTDEMETGDSLSPNGKFFRPQEDCFYLKSNNLLLTRSWSQSGFYYQRYGS